MWPIAAATFLISTGASNDNAVLGRIEYFIRQYAHKTAYIPSTVRNLGRYFREIDSYHWLVEPKKKDEIEERRNKLITLAGNGVVAEIEQKHGDLFGEILTGRVQIFCLRH